VGEDLPAKFFAPLEKCVGHSLKNLVPTQKTLHPAWCPKLVTGLFSTIDIHKLLSKNAMT